MSTEIRDKVRMEILLSDARGVYIPRDFADSFNICDENGNPITDSSVIEALEDIKNPDSETYWDSWVEVLDSVCVYSSKTKDIYFLYQDGDLFGIHKGDLEKLSDSEADEFWNTFY
jgi:hypothetical protein